jgi:hypothetical protein
VNEFLTDENIRRVADLVMDNLNNDSWAQSIKALERQIKDVDSRISNLMRALELDGDLQPVMDRITELRTERKDLEKDLARMQVDNMSFIDRDIVEFWMYDMASRNDGSQKYYRALIETFVNAIYVYDTGEPHPDPSRRDRKKRVVIAFNTSGPESTVELEVFGQAHDRTTTTTLLEHGYQLMFGGRIILIVLDY